MFIHDVCAELTKAGVSYAIVGGFAVAFHGAMRGTFDVDIAVEWTLQDLRKVESALKGLGLVPLLPVDAEAVFHFREEYIENRNMIAWNFYDPVKLINQVDVIINYDLRNKKTKLFKSHLGELRVLSLKDLIEMKKDSGRPQDLEDIKALETL